MCIISTTSVGDLATRLTAAGGAILKRTAGNALRCRSITIQRQRAFIEYRHGATSDNMHYVFLIFRRFEGIVSMKPLKPIELAALIDQAKHNMPLQFQAQAILAKELFNYFSELQKAGFTAAQALEIIKTRGLS